MPGEPQQRHASPPRPGLPALMVIGTGIANSYGLYTIRDKENRTSLELWVVAVGVGGEVRSLPGPEGGGEREEFWEGRPSKSNQRSSDPASSWPGGVNWGLQGGSTMSKGSWEGGERTGPEGRMLCSSLGHPQSPGPFSKVSSWALFGQIPIDQCGSEPTSEANSHCN